MRKAFNLLAGVIASCMVASCVSTPKEGELPSIDESTSTAELVRLVRDHGMAVLPKARELITQRNDWPRVRVTLQRELPNLARRGDRQQELVHLAHLYQHSTDVLDVEVAVALIKGSTKLSLMLGWQLMANYPSPEIATAVERVLTEIIISGLESEHYVAPLANAVAINRLVSAYTVMRQALMETGDDNFAKAMITLAPQRASSDFLQYLAIAPLEELRQLNQASINMYACMVILTHITRVAPPVNHPHFHQIFHYAVSRNSALAEIAQIAIEQNFQGQRTQLAQVLANLPAWVQIAYIESTRRRLTTNASLLLSELGNITVQPEVIDELELVIR